MQQTFPERILKYEKSKLREILNFIDEYKDQAPNIDLLITRLSVVCEFYDHKDAGVDRFVYGQDYRPDMPLDQASVIDKKHSFSMAMKKKIVAMA